MQSRKPLRAPTSMRATLAALVGTTHKGAWHTVADPDVADFVRATHNHQFIHLRTKGVVERSPYGQVIAPAYMTLSLIPYLTRGQIPRKGNTAFLNYGFNKIRFTEGLALNTKIRAESTILRVDERENGYLITRDVTVYSNKHTRPIAHAQSLLFLTTTKD